MTTGNGDRPARVHTGIQFHNAPAFWSGTAAIVAGVLLHLPEFVASKDMGYMMAGMPMSDLMLFGMALIVGGIGLAAYGLFPRRDALSGRRSALHGYHFRSMDDAPLSRAHWGLLFVLGVALVVDVMKPATLGFVVPGLREEYGISTAQAAMLPLVALTGTTIGSLLWGILADRLGRRATILLASIMFIGTAICGFMPAFGWNLLMCFLMGMSAGGMLPIVYALMAESMPAKKRGWLVVLHGGMGTVGGYLAASGFAAWLEPHFAWRILWFLGLPTGALVLLLNRWIPESPRFLLERGRIEEARGVMARYGVVLEADERAPVEKAIAEEEHAAHSARGLGRLFRPPFLPQTATVALYGVSWGLVNWGFLTFLPTMLADLGYESGVASSLLFVSALVAVPGTVVVAYAYGRWSSKKSMILYALATAGSLVGFMLIRPDPTGGSQIVLGLLVVGLLVFSGGVISMLSPYTAEVFPTYLRGTGSGLAAGSSKLGGIMGPPVMAAVLTVTAGMAGPALVATAPLLASALVLAFKGVETRDQRLEDIQARMYGEAASSSVETRRPSGVG
ncbi:MAG TPA: MFS transporter [Actinomycetota bacterium]|nr:MFS transporter [Actinomycetota bacterium]